MLVSTSLKEEVVKLTLRAKKMETTAKLTVEFEK
jgi:hypothetical protein